MDYRERADTARDLMLHFAGATGLWPARDEPRRYLWTDAFAVCNFLSLYRHYDEQRYLDLSLSLVEQVHTTLGRHRADDIRSGWISGLGEVDGAQHPTAGGLRIGKKLPERSIHQRHDPQLEWERDGQYLHYLTKWMHALCCVGAATGETHYAVWAGELAEAAWRGIQRRRRPATCMESQHRSVATTGGVNGPSRSAGWLPDLQGDRPASGTGGRRGAGHGPGPVRLQGAV